MPENPSLLPQDGGHTTTGDKSKAAKHSTKKPSSGKKRKKGLTPVDGSETPAKVSKPNVEPPTIPGFNLAGRPDSLKKTDGGLKRNEIKTVGPYHTSNINNESYLHFVVRSSKNEWIRFMSDSLTLVLYGIYNNPARTADSPVASTAALTHAMRALSGAPEIYIDPSVMGAGFFHRVEVSINNVPVPTNSAIGNLFSQYVRCCRVFNDKPGPHFATTREIVFGNERTNFNSAMFKAAKPFDYTTWNSTTGARVECYLDGVFPFDFKNRTLESVDGKKEPNLFFPPDTSIEIKFHLHRDKMASLFHPNVNMNNYWTIANVDRPGGNLTLTFHEAVLKYESAELKPAEHLKAMNQYLHGGVGIYEYDIPRGQHQALTAGQSYTENNFQIQPYARLAYIMFLQDWATFIMENSRRPLSGFSRYPQHCTNLQIGFAGEQHLITKSFERLGAAGEDHQISKKILYEYMKNRKMLGDDFEELFPRDTDIQSLIQGFVIDLKDHYSDKIEQLTVKAEFGGGQNSPANIQIVVMTVHPNGRATCKSGTSPYSWIWNFSQSV